jgi:hypothetical protein
MFLRRWKAFLLAALLMAMCAHKAPPIAKDRLNPRLSKATVINTRQIQLTFTEEIDTLSLTPENVLITSDSETLGVLLLYPSLSPSEIIIVTEPMEDIEYNIQGQVLDKAENIGSFVCRIQGSITPDTIAPWVISYSEGKSGSEFTLEFSEAMDTTELSFSIVPKKKYLPEWLTYRSIRFLPENPSESLAVDTTYYVYLRKASDISGNTAKPFITSMTRDTTHEPILLSGKALIDDTPAESGIVLLSRDNLLGVALVTKGEFTFAVRDSLNFDVLVVSGAYSGRGSVEAAADNIIRLRKEQVDIDSLVD